MGGVVPAEALTESKSSVSCMRPYLKNPPTPQPKKPHTAYLGRHRTPIECRRQVPVLSSDCSRSIPTLQVPELCASYS